MKVKIFSGDYLPGLENQINQWLSVAYAISVTEVLQSESMIGDERTPSERYVTITIFYIGDETKPSVVPPPPPPTPTPGQVPMSG